MTATRRLPAVLAADVAGYSRLTGADERRISPPSPARKLLLPNAMKIAKGHGKAFAVAQARSMDPL
jgi:hypothetical protein